MIDGCVKRLIDRIIDGLIDRLVIRFIDGLIVDFVDRLICDNWMMDGLIDRGMIGGFEFIDRSSGGNEWLVRKRLNGWTVV